MSSTAHTRSDPVPSELSQALVSAVDRLPAFPASVQSILQLTSSADCSPKELVEVIDKDPVITVKVLRVVNSVYYSLPRQIVSMDHAVVLLGFNTVKHLALSMAAMGMLPGDTLAGFDAQRYLMHSLATAGIARELGRRFPHEDPHDLFIAGLLHDFGTVVVAQVMPAEFRKALEYSLWHETSLHTALMVVCGVDHDAVGAQLLEKWRFPATLVQALRVQHALQPDCSDMALATFAANQISVRLGQDFGGTTVAEGWPAEMAPRLGGTLDQLLQVLGDLQPVLQEARRFSRM
jgi:HD-like signal output (HDOD) protein